ncbi:MAG TPA: DUF1573 domain-containing protein [Chitinophagaceae bacterium]
MKKLLLMAALLVGGLAVNAQEQKAEDLIKVNTEKHNFGKIKHNVPAHAYFEITNISDKPIVIENAWAGCGCTTPEVPKEPIAPNQTVKMKVGYNSAALAHFEKDVYVKLVGISQPKVLKITGEVLDAAAYDAQVKEEKKPGATKSLDAARSTKPAPKKVKPAKAG